jgi:hypothetical protein
MSQDRLGGNVVALTQDYLPLCSVRGERVLQSLRVYCKGRG